MISKNLWPVSVPVLGLAVVGALALGLVSARPAVAQTGVVVVGDPGGYVVDDLGALPGDTSSVAWAINANGDVVGWSMGQAGTRAFVYRNGAMVELPGLPNKPRSVAYDINDLGDIVGSANAGGTDLGHAVLWNNGSVQDLRTLGTGFFSEAWGINNLGQVVGWSYTNGGSGLSGVHGFLYSPADGLVDLTPDSDTGSARDVNDAGQVTGYKTAAGGYHAFRWQDGTFVDLGVVPGFAHSFGFAINASGQVAGNATSASGNSERFVRSIDGGGLENLGGAGEHNVAWGINASSQVVGTKGNSQSRAVRYTDAAGLQDLNTLIDPSLGWVLLGANDINDAGQIVGYAFNNFTTQTHAVRLRPTTTPPPDCSFRCLRSTSIEFWSRGLRPGIRPPLKANVVVQDENGAPIAQAMVVGTWTQPDSSTHNEYAWTGTNGVAVFATDGPQGTYTLTIVNIVRSLYTFNPSHSVLVKSITTATR